MGGRHRRLDFARAFVSFGVFALGALTLATNVESWADRWGTGRAVSFVAVGAFLTILLALWIARPIAWRKRISAVLVIGLVGSCVAFGFFKPPPHNTAADHEDPPVTTVEVPPDPTKTGCGNEARETATLPNVEICVVYWCTGAVYKAVTGAVDLTQMQYKVRPFIFNSTDHAVNISMRPPTPVRLIVESSQLPAHWSPPQKTVAAGDAVYPVIWNGKRYWAVPPNVQGDVFMAGAFWSGFSTFWDGDQLDGGQPYFKRLRVDSSGTPVQEGDLVFQLPSNPDGSGPAVIGLAYVTGGGSAPMNIEHLFPKSDWPPSVQPMSF